MCVCVHTLCLYTHEVVHAEPQCCLLLNHQEGLAFCSRTRTIHLPPHTHTHTLAVKRQESLSLSLFFILLTTLSVNIHRRKVLLQQFAVFPTWEPFLLPGKLMMSVFPRIPHTGLQHTNTEGALNGCSWRKKKTEGKTLRRKHSIMVMLKKHVHLPSSKKASKLHRVLYSNRCAVNEHINIEMIS